MSYDFTEIIRISQPANEPVSLVEVKEQLRLETDETIDDDLLTAYISAARDKCEQYCNRYFVDAAAILVFDSFPIGETPLNLTRPDITSIVGVSYYDSSNTEQTIDPVDLTLDSQLKLLYPSSSWPQSARGVKIGVQMGLDISSDPAQFVYSSVKQAILLYVADLYEQRSTLTNFQVYENQAAKMLLDPYRVNMGI